jgi:hypothetical protein
MMLLPLLLDLSGDIRSSERTKALAPFFSPRPENIVTLSENLPRNILDNGKEVKGAFDQVGVVEVQAPKKSCFIIRREDHSRDLRVCNGEKKKITFLPDEVDDLGRVYLQVFTSEKDLGSALKWNSPYRRAWVVDRTMEWPGPNRVSMVKTCQFSNVNKDRRITVETFEGYRWSISLPEKDTPSKPEFVRLLVQPDGSESELDDKETKQEPAPSEASKSENGKAPPAAKDIRTLRRWKTNWYYTYDLPGRSVSEGLTPSSDNRGRCRYGYHNDPIDKYVGVIECTDVGSFNWFMAPLPCLTPDMNPNL